MDAPKTKANPSRTHREPSHADRGNFFGSIQRKSVPFFSQGEGMGTFFQTKLNVHPAHDAYEQEADAMADRVLSMPQGEGISPAIQKQSEEEGLQTKPLVDEITRIGNVDGAAAQHKPAFDSASEMDQQTTSGGDVQSKSIGMDLQMQEESEDELQAKGDPVSPPKDFEQNLQGSKGGGQALPTSTQSRMEQGFGANFQDVRVHTGTNAVQMSQSIGAQAFTHGKDIYFNEGKYQPGTSQGDHLIAHELTHTVQQSGVQRKANNGGFEDIQASFIRDLINDLVSLAGRVGINIPEIVDNIPGYTLFSYITEYDIIRGRNVERNGRNLIRGLMGLIPGGNLLYNKLDEYGIIDRAFEWVESQLSTLDISMGRIERTFERAWDEMGISEGISGNLRILRNNFQPLLNDIETFADNAVDQLIEFVKDALVRPLVEFLEANSEAYKLATKVIGKKFPLDDEVNAPTVEILEDFLILIGKQTEVDEMKEKGTLQETADWIDTQLSTFFSLLGRFNAIVTRVWDAFSLETLEDIPGVFQGIWDDFTELLQDFLDFALEVAAKVLELIKNALLSFLASFADDIPGFHLLTVIIEKNPFTDEAVPRTTENLIRGFMSLVPGGDAKFRELKESGAIPRAAQRIDALIAQLGISWEFIVGLFTGIWESLSIDDLIDPVGAFQRIADQYGEPIGRLFSFVVKVVKILMELILEIMGIPPDMIGNIIANAMSAFEDIKNDPVGFLLNLMNAIKEGFLQFLNNIGTHLLNGLQTWLFGTLADAGIQIPSDLSLQSLLGMAMDVLGITVDNVLDRLGERIGQERVAQIRGALDTLTGIWTFVRDVIERGPIAIWEYVQQQLSNLWDIIKDGIMGFIQEKVIQQAITWLLSFLDVTGIMPIIRGVQTVFNAIQSFIEKLREILEIVNSFVAGIAEIARGNIKSAADFLENALADGIPVAISFLAKQLGLGDISEKIAEMIEAARAKINEGIDWLIDQALRAGTAFLNMLGMGGSEGESDEASVEEETGDDSDEAIAIKNRAAEELGNRISSEKPIDEIEQIVSDVYNQLSPEGLKTLELVGPDNDGAYDITGSASDHRVLMDLAPRRAFVDMVVRVQLSGTASLTEGLASTTGFFDPDEAQSEVTGGRRLARVSPAIFGGRTRGKRERERAERDSGGFVVEPEAGSDTLEFVSWSTGRAIRDSNISHAERQFEEWFSSQLQNNPGWVGRVQSISIDITHSPCQLCTPDLNGVARLARSGNPEVELNLVYDEIHTGNNPTRQSDIDLLERNGWNVSGPAIEPENSSSEVTPSPPRIRRRRNNN